MPIIPEELKFFLSGGAGPRLPDESLGGARSDTEVADGVLNNLFDQVTGAEAAAGDISYRCIYLINENTTLTLQASETFIQQNTISPDTQVAMGLGTSPIGGVEQSIPDEKTAPTGVVFTEPGTTTPLIVGDLAPNATKAVWIRWTVNAGAAPVASDQSIIRLRGDTAA